MAQTLNVTLLSVTMRSVVALCFSKFPKSKNAVMFLALEIGGLHFDFFAQLPKIWSYITVTPLYNAYIVTTPQF